MRRLTVIAITIACCASGCIRDPYLRLPQWEHRSLATERRAAEFHDPFPDETMGPRVDGRPRDASLQRTTARQASDLRGLHVLGPEARLPSKSKTAERTYGESVDQ